MWSVILHLDFLQPSSCHCNKKGEAKTTIVLAKQTVVLAVLQVCPVEDTQVLFKGASTCDCNEVNVRGLLFCAQRLL